MNSTNPKAAFLAGATVGLIVGALVSISNSAAASLRQPRARRTIRPGHYKSGDHFDRYIHEHFFANRSAPGFFVEMGALDGTGGSNTFMFEAALDWRGMLLEANPSSCAKLFENKHRSRSTRLCTAACAEGTPGGALRFEFTTDPFTSAAVDVMDPAWRKHWHSAANGRPVTGIELVPCAPLARLLRTAGVKEIDFFSLDVEGSELTVLRTMDWSIPVGVWLIEVQPAQKEAIGALLRSNGYRFYGYPLPGNEVWVPAGDGARFSSSNATAWRQYSPPAPPAPAAQ